MRLHGVFPTLEKVGTLVENMTGFIFSQPSCHLQLNLVLFAVVYHVDPNTPTPPLLLCVCTGLLFVTPV